MLPNKQYGDLHATHQGDGRKRGFRRQVLSLPKVGTDAPNQTDYEGVCWHEPLAIPLEPSHSH